jgi:hypothetical protein
MTRDEWIAKSGRAFRRAVEMENNLNRLADVAAAEGMQREAELLRKIGARAKELALTYVERITKEAKERKAA